MRNLNTSFRILKFLFDTIFVIPASSSDRNMARVWSLVPRALKWVRVRQANTGTNYSIICGNEKKVQIKMIRADQIVRIKTPN